MGRYITTTGTSGAVIVEKSGAYTARVNDRVLADSSSAAFTITLPANAGLVKGDTLQVIDVVGQFGTNNVTLDRNGGGPDDSFSLEKPELIQLCEDSKTAWQALGKIDYERKESEKDNLVFRRSLYVVKDIKEGEEFTHENVRIIRPGFGLLPKFYEDVIGSVCSCSIGRGEPLTWGMVKK